MKNTQELIDGIMAVGLDVNVEDREVIERYEKGRSIQQILPFDGWSVVVQMIHDYVDGAIKSLVQLPPGDPAVVPAHAAASALEDFRNKLFQDINDAINATPPEVILKAARKIKQAAPQF